MNVVDDLKTLTGQNESFLTIYIRRADTAISNYLNNNLDGATIEEKYPDAVIEYVTECIAKKGNESLKQFTQGSRQGTYVDGLTADVKALLPPPYAKLMG
jgi:hypothetical protein